VTATVLPTAAGDGAAPDHAKVYGLIKLDGRLQVAHRVAWRLDRGAEPSGTLDRTCPTVGCVRPDHYAEPTRQTARRAERLPRGMGHVRQRSPGAYIVDIVTGRDPWTRAANAARPSPSTAPSTTSIGQSGSSTPALAAATGRTSRATGTFGAPIEWGHQHATINPLPSTTAA